MTAVVRVGGRAYSFRGLPGPAAGEHRQLLEELLLGITQEGITPVDGGSECLLAERRRATAVAEQGEMVVESSSDLFETEQTNTRCRELQRERNPVQAAAD